MSPLAHLVPGVVLALLVVVAVVLTIFSLAYIREVIRAIRTMPWDQPPGTFRGECRAFVQIIARAWAQTRRFLRMPTR